MRAPRWLKNASSPRVVGVKSCFSPRGVIYGGELSKLQMKSSESAPEKLLCRFCTRPQEKDKSTDKNK